ncbi:MAG: hypothetical protein U0640_06910 [Phycisphaerales bacterium]
MIVHNQLLKAKEVLAYLTNEVSNRSGTSRLTVCLTILFSLSSIITTELAGAQTCGGMQDLGTLGGVSSEARGVSQDGSVVVGVSQNASGQNRAFRWTLAGGMEDLGTLPGGSSADATCVSPDGSVVVGNTTNMAGQGRVFRWTAAQGMQELGIDPSAHCFAFGSSFDGAVIVGNTTATASFPRAYRWSETSGTQYLGPLGTRMYSIAYGVSHDGGVVVGYAFNAANSQRAFRWTESGGMQNLGTLGGGASAHGVSADGIVVAGTAGVAGNGNQTRAFRWTAAGGIQNLGTLSGGLHSRGNAVSADGSVIVGSSNGNSAFPSRAFRWSASEGMVNLGTLGGDSSAAYGVSGGGEVVVGTSTNAAGETRAFRWTGGGDTDGDGLLDDWECNGVPYVDSLGSPQRLVLDVNGDGVSDADRLRKDLFVEVDSLPNQMISPAARNMVTAAFANAPVSNPDGTTGIRLHIEVSDAALSSSPVWTVVPGNTGWAAEFDPLKALNFGTGSVESRRAKARAFRYAICADSIDDASLGTAELPGNDFFITLGSMGIVPTVEQEAGTFMHELGHTLGLKHGGGDHAIGKPNYVSIMNYVLTEPLSFSSSFWRLDFSREALPTLNETSLSEPLGIASVFSTNFRMPYGVGPTNNRSIKYTYLNGTAVDWNFNGSSSETGVSQDLNYLGAGAPIAGVGNPSFPQASLHGFDDWSNLRLEIGTTGDFVDYVHQTMPENEMTRAMALWMREHLVEQARDCDSIDVNNDTSLFDPQDIEAFLSVYSEGPCIPESAACNDIDFNNDTSLFDPCDINSFLVMYSEGPCTPCGQ